MQAGPQLTAFRGDRAAQDHAQAAMIRAAQDWRGAACAAPVLDDLTRYGAGEELGDLPALSGLFAGNEPARFAADFLTHSASAMAHTPLGQPCFRHSCEGGFALVSLANCGRASLSLVVVEGDGGGARAVPASATVTAAERVEAVLAGRARGEIAALHGERLERQPRGFAPGDILRLPAWHTRLFHQVTSSLVCLRLARTPEPMPATRQISLTDGALLHEAAGDPRDTRHELMAALLTAMGRGDAVDALAGLATREGNGPARWQALKGALAMNTAAGFAALSAIASDPADPLMPDTRALRDALIARHPVLGELELA
ncbi:hypothetical protein ACFCW2_01035 [Qipengyuania sp. DSG2-2]|uniref:hypothetical protein n=1 Tax=Qipengyuania sp. DGS2-2 TaxID=3349631 RepID=UPI0036D378BB